MSGAELDLPYFDRIFDFLEDHPDSGMASALGHMHWGCFAPDEPPTPAGYLAAADRMTSRICGLARLADGQRILEVGCGFGATVEWLDARYERCDFVGLNIDERQLQHARKTVKPSPTNSTTWITADACSLPLPDGCFDAITAIECIVHFPSRQRFFAEAQRVLKPGGTLALSDYTIDATRLREMVEWTNSNDRTSPTNFYGTLPKSLATSRSYARLAARTGFRVTADEDVTVETLPTYPYFRTIYEGAGWDDACRLNDFLEDVSTRHFLEYRLLGFEKVGRPTG
jgi:ubiquinone/menaquinone biosynthesis C-methylase UbiE